MLFFFSLSIFLSCGDRVSSDQNSNGDDRENTSNTKKKSIKTKNLQHNNQKKKGSGGALQDPSGFPAFHDWPSPKGPKITKKGLFSSPKKLTQKPDGGYRPQIAIGRDDVMHTIFYMRMNDGDIIHHRLSSDGSSWSTAQPLGHSKERNWGPDLVVRDDGSVVVVYDHALKDFSSVGYISVYTDGKWSTQEALTPIGKKEVGSGHIAHGNNGELVYMFIGKQLGPEFKFQARYRWFDGQNWSDIKYLSDGREDTWHTNVERRPDGTFLGGYDIGTGGAATTLYLVDGRDGRFSSPVNVSRNSRPGERPHFAFYEKDGLITDYVTWFHKERGQPKHIYVMQSRPNLVSTKKIDLNQWSNLQEPSQGYGGFHFDPEIAVNQEGTLCLIWGWDSGEDAELVYAINKGDGWSKPSKVADINWGKPGLSSIDVDSKGNFHVVWNQGVRGYNEVYYATLERP